MRARRRLRMVAARRRVERRRTPAAQAADVNGLIHSAAQDLQDYQQLTAQGKLGEAGQKLEDLKQKLGALESAKKQGAGNKQ